MNRNRTELKHYKYIDKYYKNGEWHYIYEDRDARKLGLNIGLHIKDRLGYDEKNTYTLAKAWRDGEKETADHMYKEIDKLKRHYNSDGRIDKEEQQTLDHLKQSPDYIMGEYKKLDAFTKKALKEYEKTPLYKLEQMKEAINKGKKALFKMLGIK